jgi:hypothetical protein
VHPLVTGCGGSASHRSRCGITALGGTTTLRGCAARGGRPPRPPRRWLLLLAACRERISAGSAAPCGCTWPAAHPNVPPAFSRRENHLYVLLLRHGDAIQTLESSLQRLEIPATRRCNSLRAATFQWLARASGGRVGKRPRALLEETLRRIWTTVLPWCAPAASPLIDQLGLQLWASTSLRLSQSARATSWSSWM